MSKLIKRNQSRRSIAQRHPSIAKQIADYRAFRESVKQFNEEIVSAIPDVETKIAFSNLMEQLKLSQISSDLGYNSDKKMTKQMGIVKNLRARAEIHKIYANKSDQNTALQVNVNIDSATTYENLQKLVNLQRSSENDVSKN